MSSHPLSIDCDLRPLLDAFRALGDRLDSYTKPAAKVTADAIQRTARRLVARRTGQTAEDIVVRDDYTGKGYIVATADVLSDAEVATRRRLAPTNPNIRRRINAVYQQGLHVGLYLEGGTRRGKPRSHESAPRPFLLPAVELEAGAHERRMVDAIETGARALGFEVR